ncbi:hypothetical protein [Serratia fonticola]
MRNISEETLIKLGIYPSTTGRVLLYVRNGVITANMPILPDHHCCSLDTFIELARNAGWHVSPNHPEQEVADVA